MDRTFKIVLMCALVGILGMLVAIYLKIPSAPPTLDDLRKADAKTRQSLLMKKPLAHVSGSIKIDGTVDVSGTVDIGNTPLEVEIQR